MSFFSGCVTWTSWGSKLETIFLPVFAQMPNIKGFPVFTTPNTPLDIDMSEAVSAKDMATWRDVLSFKIKGKKKLNAFLRTETDS